MRAFVVRLQDFSRHVGEPVAVVFDGRPVETPGGGAVEVEFASRRGPDAADDDIAERVAASTDPSSIRVVTSDSALARRVRELGAEVVSAGSFLRRLDDAER